MADQVLLYLRPDGGRIEVRTSYLYDGATVHWDGDQVLALADRAAFLAGAQVRVGADELSVVLRDDGVRVPEPELVLNRAPLVRQDRARRATSGPVYLHSFLALFGSFAGFAASYLYLLRSENYDDPWALKMALHMGAWHLLLTLTLFPAALFGGRIGVRIAQLASLLFFAIHLGIGLANLDAGTLLKDGWPIALLNAASGLFFALAVLSGQPAVRALAAPPPTEPASAGTAPPTEAQPVA